MPDDNKKPVQITFNVTKKDEETYAVSWGDMSAEESAFEDALANIGEQMRERFVALAQVSDNLDDKGQEKLKELCAIFAPEKLEESVEADAS
jgi:hypothetical protein